MRVAEFGKLMKIIDMLSEPRGATIYEMAEELDLTRRSMTNWIDLIENLNFPIYEEKRLYSGELCLKLEPGFTKKLPNLTVPDLSLDFSEILSLFLLKGQGAILEGSDYQKVLQRAFHKLESFFPEGSVGSLRRLQDIFICCDGFTKDYSGKEEIIEALTLAIMTRKTLNIRYNSFSKGKLVDFAMDPLQFFENRGGLYIFYRSPVHGDVRMLAVERIEEITPTGSEFDWPEDFDGRQLLERTFDLVSDEEVDLRVRVSPDQAKYVLERKVFAQQKIDVEADGSLIVELHTTGWGDIKRWVLSLGPGAEILDPPEYRDRIRKELEETLAAYRTENPVPSTALPGRKAEGCGA